MPHVVALSEDEHSDRGTLRGAGSSRRICSTLETASTSIPESGAFTSRMFGQQHAPHAGLTRAA